MGDYVDNTSWSALFTFSTVHCDLLHHHALPDLYLIQFLHPPVILAFDVFVK